MASKPRFDSISCPISELAQRASNKLVDYDCVRLDGECKCCDPLKDCKYLKNSLEER